MWVTPDGTLKILGRDEHLTGDYVTSQATFGDGPDEIGYVELGEVVLDWSMLTNAVRRVNGDTVVEATDADSIATYGRRDRTDAAEVPSEYATLAYEGQLAAFRVAHYAEPVPHVDMVKILPAADPANMWPVAFGLEIADRATFVRRPQNIGDPISRDVFVQGIAHDVTPASWTTEFRIDAIGAALGFFLFDTTEWGSEDWRFAA